MDTTNIFKWIESTAGISPRLQMKFFWSIVVIIITWTASWCAGHFTAGKAKTPAGRYRWRKTTGYVGAGLCILFIGRIWFEGFQRGDKG